MTTTFENLVQDYRYRFLFIAFLAVIMMFTKMEGNGLAGWDDCFYAQKAKEIHDTGSWMTMHYAGAPAFENPPFFIWLIRLSYDIWGVNEYGAIFPSALFGVLSVLLVYHLARKLYDSWTAFFSALVLTTTFYFTKYARHAMIDVTLSFFVTLAFVALVVALRRDKRYFLVWGLAISGSVLLKSVLGFFPLLITVAYLFISGRWRIVFSKWFLIGTVIVLAIGCSWYIHQYLLFGTRFLDLHFGWLIIQRGFQTKSETWYAHLSYVQDLLVYYWPWVPVFAWGLYRFVRLALKKDDNALLLTSWVVIYIGVLSLTQQRMLWYIMPVFPAAAIICGHTLVGWMGEASRVKMTRWIMVSGIVAALIMNLTPLQLALVRERDFRTLAPYVRHFAGQKVRLIGCGYTYYAINNPLLFYSDYAAQPVYENYHELASQFADSSALVCVVSAGQLDSVLAHIPNTYILRRTEGASLIANKPLDVTSITAP